MFPVPDDVLISSRGIGPIRLGISLDSIAKKTKDLDIARTSDGEGVALVEIALGLDTVIAYSGEEDPSSAIDATKPIRSLETMTPGFQTAVGIHPGSLVSDAVSVYGRIAQIQKSEIESREFVTFANQPKGMTFRLDSGSGVFDEGSTTTTRLVPRARIFSIMVSM